MIETLALVFFRKRLPVKLGCLQQGKGSHDVCTRKSERILDAAIHMAFGRQVDNTVHMVLLHQFANLLEIADVRLDKRIVRLIFDVFQVCQVSGVGQFVQVDDPIIRIFVYKQPHYMRSDESGSAGNDDISFKHVHG